MPKRIDPIKIIGILLLVAGLGIVFLHKYPSDWPFNVLVNNFYANLSTELISISITVLLINYLYEVKENKNYIRRLICELGSEEKGISSRAVKELKENGCLKDGTLMNANLTNSDLSNLDLSGANLEGVIFDYADLTNTKLKCANLRNCRFSEASLVSANLDGADITNSTFHSANLYQAILNKINSRKVDFMNCNLKQSEMIDCKYFECKLEDASLELTNLSRTKFENSIFMRVNFHSSNINDAKFERCDLNSIKNWDQLVNRNANSFLAPVNPNVTNLSANPLKLMYNITHQTQI